MTGHRTPTLRADPPQQPDPQIQHGNQDIERSESALYPLTDANLEEAEQAQVRG